jgi:hypothetical protein
VLACYTGCLVLGGLKWGWSILGVGFFPGLILIGVLHMWVSRLLTDRWFTPRFGKQIAAKHEDLKLKYPLAYAAESSRGEMTTASAVVFSGTDQVMLRQAIRAYNGSFLRLYPQSNGGIPFYVGKGQGRRVLAHEAEARTTIHLTHKPNIIRKLQREARAILYEIESVHRAETDALARERLLIETIGRHDLKRGPLTNQTDGGEGTSNPSEDSRQRRRDSLWGEAAEDSERRITNSYFQRLTAVRSVPIKPASSFKVESLAANRQSSPRRRVSRRPSRRVLSLTAFSLPPTAGSRAGSR